MAKIVRVFTQELVKRLKEPQPLIQVVIGPRQVGKTTGVQQVLQSGKREYLYVSADESLHVADNWLSEQWQKAMLLPAGSILAIDEIQKIPHWQDTLKLLWDNRNKNNLRVIILGSSSFEIQQGLKESLAGRYEVIKVYHWNAQESKLMSLTFEQHLVQGGYPGSYRLLSSPQRWQKYIQESILENVLHKDILRLRPLAKPALFRQFIEIVRAYPCQEISYHKLLGQLQDKGNIDLIKNYLFLLECAFLYRALEKYSKKEYLKKGSSPKIVPLCPALCTGLGDLQTWKKPENKGRLFEVLVAAELNKLPGSLYYWREKNAEVDFIYETDKTYAIEVKSGRKKRPGGLAAFLKIYPKAIPVFIDMDNYSLFEKAPNLFLEKLS